MPAGTEEAVLTRLRNSLSFLVETRMRTMVGEGRAEELRAILTDLFGEDATAATVERLRTRTGAESSDSH